MSRRLVHFVGEVTIASSGPSYSVLRLCESLSEFGDENALITLDAGGYETNHKLVRKFPFGIGPRRLGRSPQMRRWLRAEATAGLIKLIHSHGMWLSGNIYPAEISRKFGVPLVVSPRGTLSSVAMQSGSVIKRAHWPLLQRPALQAACCFHATAITEYADIRRMGFTQPVAIIPNGIDVPDLCPRETSSTRTLLFLGRIHPIKGIDALLRAWQLIQTQCPTWRLRIAGPDNDNYLEKMRLLAAELQLARVEFSGELVGEAKWQAYRDAELFILPTHSENFGISVAEAMAAGLPVIVSTGAPWEDVVTKGAGWWISNSPDNLALTLLEAMAQKTESLQEMGRRGRSWMAADFSWAKVGRMMSRTYDWLLSGGITPEWVQTN